MTTPTIEHTEGGADSLARARRKAEHELAAAHFQRVAALHHSLAVELRDNAPSGSPEGQVIWFQRAAAYCGQLARSRLYRAIAS
jgi:hypothetical protein